VLILPASAQFRREKSIAANSAKMPDQRNSKSRAIAGILPARNKVENLDA
jgi:hypothetical protein